MSIDLDAWQMSAQNNDIEIIRATNKKTLQDFSLGAYLSLMADVLTAEDPFEFYVGYLIDKPVTRGLLVLYAQVAGIYCLPSVGDAAMLQYLLQRAKSLGYHVASLFALNSEETLFKNYGFKSSAAFLQFQFK